MNLSIIPGMDFVTLILSGDAIDAIDAAEVVRPADFIWALSQYRRAFAFEPAPRVQLDQDEILACTGAV